jgi:hypothetical protein
MDPLLPILASFGINISSSAIYDLIKVFFARNQEANRDDFESALTALLRVHNANMAAEGIISFLVNNGDILIDGSKIYSKDSIQYKSSKQAKFRVGNQTTSSTPKSFLDLGKGAFVEGQGGAAMEQDKDGNFIFKT